MSSTAAWCIESSCALLAQLESTFGRRGTVFLLSIPQTSTSVCTDCSCDSLDALRGLLCCCGVLLVMLQLCEEQEEEEDENDDEPGDYDAGEDDQEDGVAE